MSRPLNCDGDYRLQGEWLERHKNADLILYDTNNDLPAVAVYANPIYQSYVVEPAAFFEAVREALGKRPPEPYTAAEAPSAPKDR